MTLTIAEKDAVYKNVVQILTDLTADWDVGPIDAGTPISGLGLDSLGIVYLIAEIQRTYQLQHRFVDKLIHDGINIMSLTVGDIVQMIEELCDTPA